MKQKIFKHSSTNFLRNKKRNDLIIKRAKEKYLSKRVNFLDNSKDLIDSFFIDSDHIKL